MTAIGDLIEQGQFVDGNFCVDCWFVLNNGESQNPDPDWDRAAMSRTFADYEILPGHLHTGPYSDCVHAGRPCEDDCDCAETNFSSSQCSGCATTVAGHRFDVTMVAREDLAQ